MVESILASEATAQVNGVCAEARPRLLQVGVVGIGRMGQRHALNLLRLVPRARLVCACSPAEMDLQWAQEHLVPAGVKVFRTFDEMIECPGLEAVVIASATALHHQHTLDSLRRGIHVLCEKPIASSMQEVGRQNRSQQRLGETYTNSTQLNDLVVKAEASPRAKVMVGFTRRFDENYQDALQKIRAGAIGKPVVIRSQGLEKLDDSDFMHSYLRASGGIFFDSVIHDIDLALSFFGNDAQPKSVCAFGTTAHFKELEVAGDADNAVGICQFWGGQIAYFYNSRTAAGGYDNQTEIFGTTGKISVNLVSRLNRVEVSDASGIHLSALPGWYDRYVASFVTEMIAFVDAVLDDHPMPIPLQVCVTSLNIALALQKSLRSGEKIDFDKAGLPIENH